MKRNYTVSVREWVSLLCRAFAFLFNRPESQTVESPGLLMTRPRELRKNTVLLKGTASAPLRRHSGEARISVFVLLKGTASAVPKRDYLGLGFSP